MFPHLRVCSLPASWQHNRPVLPAVQACPCHASHQACSTCRPSAPAHLNHRQLGEAVDLVRQRPRQLVAAQVAAGPAGEHPAQDGELEATSRGSGGSDGCCSCVGGVAGASMQYMQTHRHTHMTMRRAKAAATWVHASGSGPDSSLPPSCTQKGQQQQQWWQQRWRHHQQERWRRERRSHDSRSSSSSRSSSGMRCSTALARAAAAAAGGPAAPRTGS